jgi:hypothetical protein
VCMGAQGVGFPHVILLDNGYEAIAARLNRQNLRMLRIGEEAS